MNAEVRSFDQILREMCSVQDYEDTAALGKEAISHPDCTGRILADFILHGKGKYGADYWEVAADWFWWHIFDDDNMEKLLGEMTVDEVICLADLKDPDGDWIEGIDQRISQWSLADQFSFFDRVMEMPREERKSYQTIIIHLLQGYFNFPKGKEEARTLCMFLDRSQDIWVMGDNILKDLKVIFERITC